MQSDPAHDAMTRSFSAAYAAICVFFLIQAVTVLSHHAALRGFTFVAAAALPLLILPFSWGWVDQWWGSTVPPVGPVRWFATGGTLVALGPVIGPLASFAGRTLTTSSEPSWVLLLVGYLMMLRGAFELLPGRRSRVSALFDLALSLSLPAALIVAVTAPGNGNAFLFALTFLSVVAGAAVVLLFFLGLSRFPWDRTRVLIVAAGVLLVELGSIMEAVHGRPGVGITPVSPVIYAEGAALLLFGIGLVRKLPAKAVIRLEEDSSVARSPSLPYLSLPALAALLLFEIVRHPPVAPDGALVLISTVVLVLIPARQVLARRDVQSLARQLEARNLALQEANRRLEELATSDSLTGLPNHRGLITTIDYELERAQRYNRPCSILYIDVDQFRALNDSAGHLVGDEMLCELSVVVRGVLRTVDVLGRWGGEEFLAVLPETDREQALRAAERVRVGVADHRFAACSNRALTLSVGVATFPDDAVGRDSLINMADEAMRAAKQLGCNQVRHASEASVAAGARNQSETIVAGTVEALVALIEARDEYTGAKALRVAQLCRRLGLALGLGGDRGQQLVLAARLHDVGKVTVPETILLKPGPLEPDEWDVVRRHAAAGAEIVARVPGLDSLVPIIRAHHEQWDGTGYPGRLSAERIPLEARIIAVADAFAAMRADRPHRRAMSLEATIAEIKRCAGTQFDPEVVAALERVLAPEIDLAMERGA